MTEIIGIELLKIFSKWRTYIGFLAIGILTPFVQIALAYKGERYLEFATRSLSNSFIFVGDLFNGYLVGHLVLQSLFIHIPFLIVLVGGDLLAGEATAGTYRILLTRPVTRFMVVTSKFIAGLIYTNLLLLWLAFLSLVVSIILFGTGELIVLADKLYIFAADDVLWRFIGGYGLASISMTTVLSLSFLFSSLVENAIGPIIATMAVIIIFIVISALPIEFMEVIQPYMFTSHMPVWRELFFDPINWEKAATSCLILVGHILLFYVLTVYIFFKKDIIS